MRHRHHRLFFRNVEFVGNHANDAAVGLVRHPHVDGIGRHPGSRTYFARRFRQRAHRKLKDLLAVHVNVPRPHDRIVVKPRWERQRRFAEAAVGVHAVRQNAGLIRHLKHHGPSAVPKEHTGRTILTFNVAREKFCSYYDRPTIRPRSDETVCVALGINKPRAHGLHVKRRTARCAQRGLEPTTIKSTVSAATPAR